ncbi:hypothetical protein Pst134EB_008000 [Puccinia striiformis f. sp. tritici]|uniref:Uncharacterized protein n=1 Tax=Puccinia striiformis f. sp. tritici PST-78 TaxID=1165861 RepID=A0A0L0VAS3_9BASI|nr:hypothetical protein Pst134EB_008000 [Puccinia striiformis f. sp. tritici]KNE96362.1 hypothetical protein PSTG_10328 [Puccinia striiformis f. sp. tritici PST-78]
MGVPLLPIWLLLTGLLGPIGESTCLITYEDTFKFAKNDASALLSKRKGATEFFGAPQPLSKLEYAQKITWKHPGTYESKGEVSHMRTEADHAAQILEYLEEHVFPRLYLLMYRKLGKPFAEGTEEKYLKKMQALLGYSRKLLSEMDETIMEPEGLDRIPRSKAASKASFSKLFEYFHDICGVLRSGMKLCKDDIDFYSNDTVFKMIFGLSDALAEYLSILQTHPLVNVQDLTESLNEGDHWIVLFHCVLGRSPPEDKATSVFLTYDFKKSLQQSGRIEDIHSLLDLMKEENWRKMENLYLLMRIGLKRTHPMFFKTGIDENVLRDTEMWERVKEVFYDTAVNKVDLSSQYTFNYLVKSAMTELANHITKIPAYTKRSIVDINWQLTQLHLTLNLIYYFIQFLVDHDGRQIIQQLKRESFYPKLQGIDKSFKFLHDVLKIGKNKLGEIETIPKPEHSINEKQALEEHDTEADFKRNQEMKRTSVSLNPQSETGSWVESLLDQPIANKLDRLTFEPSIEYPSAVPETEKTFQLLKEDFAPEFEIALPLIDLIKKVVEKYDLMKHLREGEQKATLRNLFNEPVRLVAKSL